MHSAAWKVRDLPGVFLFLGLFSFLGIALILSFSRGAWVNFSIAIIFYFTLRLKGQKSRSKRKRLVKTAVGMMLASSLALALAFSIGPVRDMLEVRAKVVQYYDLGSEMDGGKSRLDVQRETLLLALSTPVGIGAGQSEAVYYQNKAPHNLFLHTLSEGGWVGGLAFYAFLVLTCWNASKFSARSSDVQELYHVAYASLLGILVQSLFIDSTHWRQLYLLLGMLWGPYLAVQAQNSLTVRRILAY